MKAKSILVTLMSILSGMILGSLWITHDESWKIYLPILLILITYNTSCQSAS